MIISTLLPNISTNASNLFLIELILIYPIIKRSALLILNVLSKSLPQESSLIAGNSYYKDMDKETSPGGMFDFESKYRTNVAIKLWSVFLKISILPSHFILPDELVNSKVIFVSEMFM